MKKFIVMFSVLLAIGFVYLGIMRYRVVKLEDGARAYKYGGDSLKALASLKALSFWGDRNAQELLGHMYAFGRGVKKNDDEAIRWYRKAGSKNIGKCDKAAEYEYYVAEYYLMIYNDKTDDSIFNAAEALKWFTYSANGGYYKSAIILGEAYRKGSLFLSRDEQTANKWFVKSRNGCNDD